MNNLRILCFLEPLIDIVEGRVVARHAKKQTVHCIQTKATAAELAVLQIEIRLVPGVIQLTQRRERLVQLLEPVSLMFSCNPVLYLPRHWVRYRPPLRVDTSKPGRCRWSPWLGYRLCL
jgi:hypothetical protein